MILRRRASFGYIGVIAPLFSKIVGLRIFTFLNSIFTSTSRGGVAGVLDTTGTSSFVSTDTRIAVPAVPAAARVVPV